MADRFYEDPSGFHRDVPIEPMVAKHFAEAEAEEIEKILDAAVGRGAIADRFDWRNRLRREPELAREILESLPGDREFAEKAALRDPRLGNLRREWDAFLGIEEEVQVRAYADARKSDSERLYDRLAEATNQHLFA